MKRFQPAAVVASLVFCHACGATMESAGDSNGRLTARPSSGTQSSARGEQHLGLDARRDGVLFVPSAAEALRQGSGQADRVPLLLMLHGAGGSGEGVLRRVRE